MSKFKNNPYFKLYYSDTDSIIIDKPLPEYMIGSELGQLKLENKALKAFFIAPKVYGLINDSYDEIIKIKGLNKNDIKDIKLSDLETLLIKDTTKIFTQEKGYKDLYKGNISLSDMIYTLKATSNKRHHVYENDIFNNTKPYNYEKIKD
jgi:hypothetical protein